MTKQELWMTRLQEDRHRTEASWRREGERRKHNRGKEKLGDRMTAYLHTDDSVYEE